MMKFKRVLLIVTIGVSFAPPVFASADFGHYRTNAAQTGEQNEPNPLGSQCELSQVNKGAEQGSGGSASGASSGSAL